MDGVAAHEAILHHANISGATLEEANFTKAKCLRANLKGYSLQSVDFSEADLSYANLDKTDLLHAKFPRVNLSATTFHEARVISEQLAQAYNPDKAYPAEITGSAQVIKDIRSLREAVAGRS